MAHPTATIGRPDPPAAPVVSDGLSGIIGQIGDIGAEADKRVAEDKKKSDAIIGQMREVQQRAASIPEPSALQLSPHPRQDNVDIMQGVANPMAILAIFGSLLTRRPMINALNAASQAMQGYAQGNKEAYDRAEQAWKNNMEIALKNHQDEMDRWRMKIEEAGQNMQMLQAELTAEASQNQDYLALMHLKAGQIDQLLHYKEITQQQAIAAQQRIDMLNWRKEMHADTVAHQQEMAKQGQERIDASKAKTEKATRDRNRAIAATEDQVDKAIAMIDKDPTVVGGLGFLRGAGEKALGIASDVGLAGQQTDTPANNFAQIINSIQLTAQNTLRGTASRWKDAKMQEILSGLSMTSSSQVAKNQLLQFKALLQSMSADEMPSPDVPLPAVGDVQDGYIYNGGDPGDAASWTQAPQ